MTPENFVRRDPDRDLDSARRTGQAQFELGPGPIASLLLTHADALRSIARDLDGDFDPHGLEGSRTQGNLRRIAAELQELSGDVRRYAAQGEKQT